MNKGLKEYLRCKDKIDLNKSDREIIDELKKKY